MKTFGYFDTYDNLWLGDEAGPFRIHETEPLMDEHGRIYREMLANAQLKYPHGRVRLMEHVAETFTHRDSVDVQREALECVTALEEGRL